MAETQSRVDSVLPDLETASSSPPDTVKKVELDLDDAPFLRPDEPAQPPAHFEENIPPEDDGDKGKKKKRLILVAAIAGGVLLIALAAIWFFFIRQPPPPPPEGPKPDVVVVPSTPVAPESHEIIRSFAPFVVPITD
ncbi:MAG: flagellar basal body protein FliL, partial [Desulfovibrio sp.]|nr:flagellar basal body protein FliL [Desulfovibrio sp.]